MSSSLTEQLFQQLQGAPLQQIAQQLGAGQDQTATAVGAALPLLLGALGRNASQPQGAEALFGALQKDFSGAGDLGGLLGAVLGGAQSRQTNGAGILGHVLGGQLPRAEAGLGQATGLGSDKAGQLMRILAPIVLASARQVSGQGRGAAAIPRRWARSWAVNSSRSASRRLGGGCWARCSTRTATAARPRRPAEDRWRTAGGKR